MSFLARTEASQSGAGRGSGQHCKSVQEKPTRPACRTWSRPLRSVSATSPARRSCSLAASPLSPRPCYCCRGCCSCWRSRPWPPCWSWAWWESSGARWRYPSSRSNCSAQNGPVSRPAAWQGLESCVGPGCDTPAAWGCGWKLPAVARPGRGRGGPLACGRTGLFSCRGVDCRIRLREARIKTVWIGAGVHLKRFQSVISKCTYMCRDFPRVS